MSKNSGPKKWWEVYPKNTTAGDEERKMFIALARDPQYEWRSVSAIASESGLTKTRVEEILDKYHNAGMVFQNSKNPELWGYWERVKPELATKKKTTLADEDKAQRLLNKLGKGKKP